MKNDSLNVYERPEAEELELVTESNYLGASMEQPIDPCPEYEGTEI